MADTFDILGRKIDSANMSLGELKGLVGSLMKSKVGPAQKFEKEKKPVSAAEKAIIELKKLFEDYAKDFKKETDEQKKLMKDVVDALQNVKIQKQNKATDRKVQSKPEKPTSLDKKIARGIDGLYQEGVVKKNSIATHDPRVVAALHGVQEAIESLGTALGASTSKGGGGGGGGGGGKIKIKTIPPDDDDFEAKSWGKSNVDYGAQLARQFFSDVREEIGKLENALSGFNAGAALFEGMIVKEREFVQDIRKIAYETGNATKETVSLNRQYEQLSKIVAETGATRSEFQEEYKKALKGGIKDLKTATSITKSQLSAENQLGLKAGDLGEEFRNWTQSGKMSINQISAMSRGMIEVARNTGITGDALKSAVSSSGEFIKNLKNAGMLTSSASKNVFELVANAQKLDIASEMQPLLQAMTSSTNLLFESSDQTKSLLFAAAGSMGRIADLQKGIITRSKGGLKDMAKGIENVLQQFGVQSMDAIDTLSEDAKYQLNLSLKSSFNLELDQVKKVYETLNNAGKTYSERLNDIDNKRKKNLTLEEKNLLLEEERRLKASHSLDILTKLDEATLEGGKNMNKAFATFTDKLQKDFEKEFNDPKLGMKDKSGQQIAVNEMVSAVDEINKGLKKYGKDQIKLSSAEIQKVISRENPEAIREMIAKVNEGNQKLSTAQKANLDPMSSLKESIEELNESIRMYTNSGVSALFNSVLGKVAALTIAIGGLTTAIGFFGLNIWATFTGFSNTFEKASKYFSKSIGKLRGREAVQAGAEVAKSSPQVIKSAASKLGTKELEIFKMNKNSTMSIEKFAQSIGYVDDVAESAAESVIKSGSFIDKFKRGFVGLKDIFKSGLTKVKQVQSGFYRLGESLTATSNNIKIIDKYGEAFSKGGLRGAFKETYSNLNKFGTQIKDIGIKAKNSLNVSKSFVSFVGDVTNVAARVKDSRMIAGATQVGSDVANVGKRSFDAVKTSYKAGTLFADSAKGISQGLTKIASLSTKTAGGLLRLAGTMNPLGLAIAAVFAALDIGIGAAEAGARADKIFGKEMKDVSLNEEYAAKSAGALVGLLNGFTLGILGLIFPLNEWTDSLAKINAKVPILTALMTPLIVAIEIVWGLIQGIGLLIYDVFAGLYEGVKNMVVPVFEGLSDIFSTLGSMFMGASDQTSGFANTLRELGGVAGIVKNVVRSIGTAIGWIFKTLGAIIGFISKAFLKVIQGMLVVVTPFIEVFKEIGSTFYEVGKVVYSAIEPIIWGFGLLSSLFGSSAKSTNDWSSAISVLMDVLVLVGKTIGFVAKIFIRYFLSPIVFFAKAISGVAQIIQGITKGFRALFGLLFGFDDFEETAKEAQKLLYDGFTSILQGVFNLPLSIGKDILDLLGLTSLGTNLYNTIASSLSDIGSFLYDGMVGTFQKVMEYIMSWIPGSKSMMAFSASEEENKKRVQNDGASLAGGLSRGLGGLLSLNLQKTIGGAGEFGSAALATVNPFNYFEKGTKKVENTGLAVLHKNEMVVPANETKNITSGGKPFDKGFDSLLEDTINPLIKNIKNVAVKGFDFMMEPFLEPLMGVGKGFDFMMKDSIMGPLFGSMMESIVPKSLLGVVDKEKANMQPISNTPDIHNEIAAEKAKSSPNKSEVSSSELSVIASESESQSQKLDTLIHLFEQVVKELKSEPTTLGSSGGNMPDTSLQKIRHKSPNYFRNNVGLVAQTAAKSVVNLGPQNI